MSGNSSSGDSATSASMSVFMPIAAPILRSVDPVQVSRFLKERERYEIEIASKQSEIPSLRMLPYTASIDRSLLKSLFYMGKFDKISPTATQVTDLSDEHIKTYIDSIVARSDGDTIDPSVIDKALIGFAMPTHITDPEARITHYCADFFERLESVGHGSFRDKNPKLTVKLLIKRLAPKPLKQEMSKRVQYDESLEKNVKSFIGVLAREAINCQTYAAQDKDSDSLDHSKGVAKNDKKPPKPSKKPGKPHKEKNGSETPLCLWEEHRKQGIRHLLRHCEECPKEEKNRLYAALRAEKKDASASAKRTTEKRDATSATATSVTFTACIEGKWHTSLSADNCADANIIDASAISAMKAAGVTCSTHDLVRPRTFEMAAHHPNGEPAILECQKTMTTDVELHIRHGTALTLRGVQWLITEQHLGEPLLGRPLLEALGLNTREILAAAADKHGGVVHVSDLLDAYAGGSRPGRVARITEGIFHTDGGADDADLDESDGWLDLGPEDPAEKKVVFQKKLDEARANGISQNGLRSLETLLRDFDDVVKLKLDEGEPADIEPLRIRLKPGSVPVRAKQRKYHPAKRVFMTRYVKELARLGFVKPAISPEWVSAPLIVPKRPPAMFRFALDNRPVNNATEPTFWPMPNIDSELADTRGATVFVEIDFCSSYWQAPLHRDSQALYAFMTHFGVFMPTRTPQGGCNSAANFQEKVEPCFAELRANMKAWLDDFLLFAKSEEEMFGILRTFFSICRERRLIVSLPKSSFFQKEARWCGRIIDSSGVRFNPKNISGLTDCSPPDTAGELCEYVHGISWVSPSIPRFAERVAPLRAMLEKAYESAGGSRKKKSISRLKLDKLGWGASHVASFNDLQNQLRAATRLCHRDPSKTLCIHTDASDLHWAVCATQCQAQELSKAPLEQRHEPLSFLSGTCSDREAHWSTYEREAFAVVQAFRKLDYLLTCDTTTRLFTDHRNLLFAFNPVSMEPSLGRHNVLKVIRWALFLSAFHYLIEHVPGDLNIWPDVMTRWMRGYRRPSSVKRLTSVTPFTGVTSSPSSEDFTWPSRADIVNAQATCTAPRGATNEAGIVCQNNKIWIPDDASDLKLRLLTIAHAGDAGHRGVEASEHALRERFTWTNLRGDAREFVSRCLLCILSKTGDKIPRPLSTTAHASQPNEILHFDYLFLGNTSDPDDPLKYVLVVKDDLSGYCWLKPSCAATAEHTAEVLAEWNRVFTAPKIWVSDQGSHFKNEVLAHLSRVHHIRHRLTIAYSPWTNGTAEALMRPVLSATRAMLGELKLAPSDWPSIIPAISTALNSTSLPRLGHRKDGIARTPLEVMTGIRPERPVLQILPTGHSTLTAPTISLARISQVACIDDLQTGLDNLHKDVQDKTQTRRDKAIEAHNRATNIVTPSFSVGDYVLVRRATDRGHKLQFRWLGPRQITSAHSPLVYSVTPLRGGSSERVHCTRLVKYTDNLLGTVVHSDILDLANRTETRYEIVERIIDVGEADDGLFLRVSWEGLPDENDWTWNPLNELFADIPDMVKEFLSTFKTKKSLITKCKRQLSLL